MAYEHNNGSGTLFRNQKKETEKHPDYKGDGKLPDGTPVWISGWIKESSTGSKFLSLALQLKDEQPKAEKKDEKSEDDLPF
jgi:uncharacterized protein (DUF736 family)